MKYTSLLVPAHSGVVAMETTMMLLIIMSFLF